MDVIILKDLEYCGKTKLWGIDVYRKTGHTPPICGLPGEKFEYLFWKGRFCGIIFFEEGFSGYEPFRDAVFQEFGQGVNLPDQEYYVWEGKENLHGAGI